MKRDSLIPIAILNGIMYLYFLLVEGFYILSINYLLVTCAIIAVSLLVALCQKIKVNFGIVLLIKIFLYVNVMASSIYILERNSVFHPSHNERAHNIVSRIESVEKIHLGRYSGWLYTSGEFERAPLVIYFDGNGGNAATMFQHMQVFEQWDYFNGFSFLQIDYPGFGLSGGLASQQNIFDMAKAAYDYAQTREDIDGDNIFVMGFSLGTAVATYLASQREVRGLILFAPFDEMRTMYNIVLPIFYGPMRGFMRFTFPSNRFAQEVGVRPLIVSSRDDETTPFSAAARLAEAFPLGADLIDLSDFGHGGYWSSTTLRFVQEYLANAMEGLLD